MIEPRLIAIPQVRHHIVKQHGNSVIKRAWFLGDKSFGIDVVESGDNATDRFPYHGVVWGGEIFSDINGVTFFSSGDQSSRRHDTVIDDLIAGPIPCLVGSHSVSLDTQSCLLEVRM